MVNNSHDAPQTNLPPDMNLTEFAEDPMINQSLETLSKVDVPADFLPTVMYQVYERHHRDKVNWVFTSMISLALLISTLIFFTWDAADYGKTQNVDGFGTALTEKFRITVEPFQANLDAFGNIVKTTWKVTTAPYSKSPVLAYGLTLVILVATVLFWRRRTGRGRRS